MDTDEIFRYSTIERPRMHRVLDSAGETVPIYEREQIERKMERG